MLRAAAFADPHGPKQWSLEEHAQQLTSLAHDRPSWQIRRETRRPKKALVR